MYPMEKVCFSTVYFARIQIRCQPIMYVLTSESLSGLPNLFSSKAEVVSQPINYTELPVLSSFHAHEKHTSEFGETSRYSEVKNSYRATKIIENSMNHMFFPIDIKL